MASSSSPGPTFHPEPDAVLDDDDDDPEGVTFHAGEEILPKPLWPTVPSAFAKTGETGSLSGRDVKTNLAKVTAVASKAVPAVGHVPHVLSAAHLMAPGAAAGAALTAGTGGIALGVAGPIATATGVVIDASSLVSTLAHRDGLARIEGASTEQCRALARGGNPGIDHDIALGCWTVLGSVRPHAAL